MSSRTPKPSLGLYFLLAYAFSWSVQIPLALQAQGLIQTHLPFSLHYLSAFGPLLAAVAMTWLENGSQGLRSLFNRLFRWRVHPVWWLVAVAPLVGYLLIGLGGWAIQGGTLHLYTSGQVDFISSNLGIGALLLWIFTFGFGEETGWRGYALPRLQEGRSALFATLILWVFWALWHLPLFFYAYEASILPGFLLGLLAGAISLTWLYNSTGGSILMAALWHGTFNFTTGCTSCKTGMVAALISALVMFWAVMIVILFTPERLSRPRWGWGASARQESTS